MLQYYYDGQIRRYITQFIRAISGVSYKDNKGNIVEVPVRFGNTNKQAASVMRQNSENFLMQAPFISVYVQQLELSRPRMQDPTFVSKVHIREREYDEVEGWQNTKGNDVTVERLMPNPYQLTLKADIWSSNIDQKLQILEQLIVLFNPAIDLQTSDNFVDWGSLTTLELTGIEYTNQIIPTGNDELEIASLTFMAPIWLSPPAKVKRMGVITSIIARIFDEEGNYTDDLMAGSIISRQAVTIDGYGILVTNNATSGTPQYVAQLLNYVEGIKNDFSTKSTKQGENINWRMVLEKYPGKFVANLSKITLVKPDGLTAEATISLNSNDEKLMNLTFNSNTLPSDTLIDSSGRRFGTTGFNQTTARGNIDAIIDPTKPLNITKIAGMRFLILEDINTVNRNYGPESASLVGVEQWGSFTATANDIILWDGTSWSIIFNSNTTAELTYITNIYTGVQYKWESDTWSKSMEGSYLAGDWRIVL